MGKQQSKKRQLMQTTTTIKKWILGQQLSYNKFKEYVQKQPVVQV